MTRPLIIFFLVIIVIIGITAYYYRDDLSRIEVPSLNKYLDRLKITERVVLVNVSCNWKDTDGFNEYETGKCLDMTGKLEDVCIGDFVVKEFYIDSGERCLSGCKYKLITCPTGCENGKCKEVYTATTESTYCNNFCLNNRYNYGECQFPVNSLCQSGLKLADGYCDYKTICCCN